MNHRPYCYIIQSDVIKKRTDQGIGPYTDINKFVQAGRGVNLTPDLSKTNNGGTPFSLVVCDIETPVVFALRAGR